MEKVSASVPWKPKVTVTFPSMAAVCPIEERKQEPLKFSPPALSRWRAICAVEGVSELTLISVNAVEPMSKLPDTVPVHPDSPLIIVRHWRVAVEKVVVSSIEVSTVTSQASRTLTAPVEY